MKNLKKVKGQWIAIAAKTVVITACSLVSFASVTPSTNAQEEDKSFIQLLVENDKSNISKFDEKEEMLADENLMNYIMQTIENAKKIEVNKINTVEEIKLELEKQAELELSAYVIQYGDTLFNLSQAMKVDYNDLRELNGYLEEEAELMTGDIIIFESLEKLNEIDEYNAINQVNISPVVTVDEPIITILPEKTPITEEAAEEEPEDTNTTVVVETPEGTTTTVVEEPEDTTTTVIYEPEDTTTTTTVVDKPEDTTTTVVNAPEDTTTTVVEEPEDTTTTVVDQPEDTTTTVVDQPEDTTTTVVDQPEDTTTTVADTTEDTTTTVVVENPEDTTTTVVDEPEDTTTTVVDEPEDTTTTGEIIEVPDDTTTTTEPEDGNDEVVSIKTSEQARLYYNYAKFNNEFLKLVNQERKMLGLNRVGFSPILHKEFMVPRVEGLQENGNMNFFDKNGNQIKHAIADVEDASDEQQLASVDYVRLLDDSETLLPFMGENLVNSYIPQGSNTENLEYNLAVSMFEVWKNSPGHYRNMISEGYVTIVTDVAFSDYYRAGVNEYTDQDMALGVMVGGIKYMFANGYDESIEILNGIEMIAYRDVVTNEILMYMPVDENVTDFVYIPSNEDNSVRMVEARQAIETAKETVEAAATTVESSEMEEKVIPVEETTVETTVQETVEPETTIEQVSPVEWSGEVEVTEESVVEQIFEVQPITTEIEGVTSTSKEESFTEEVLTTQLLETSSEN
ncbi:LysM peptidoglycan-binding domain-containing protein [Facklamia sp. P12945]|uniref:LysM peptidoglycan-binding domain-containing protein n=1 Tax=Facklamia sp. P12945 TaxID=3421950 RepID=UPI003D18627C